MVIEDKLSGERYTGPDGSTVDPTKYNIVQETGGLGPQSLNAAAPAPSEPASGTMKSGSVAAWLGEHLPSFLNGPSPLGNTVPNLLEQIPTNQVGGMIGGTLAPAALAALGGPAGLGAGAVAGAMGGGGLQAIQDYLTQGGVTGNTALQAGLGAAGPVVSKAISGAGMLGSAVLRKMGVLPDLLQRALASGADLSTAGLPELANTMRSESASPSAKEVAAFIDQKLGTTPAAPESVRGNVVSEQWIKDYLAKQAGAAPTAGPPETIPVRDFQAIRNNVGPLTDNRNISSSLSGGWYETLMDGLRAQAANTDNPLAAKAAQDLLRNADEIKALKAATPRLPWWLGGAAGGMGLGFYLHSPQTMALSAGLGVGIPAVRGVLAGGTYNPYLSGAGTATLEQLLGGTR